MTTRRQVLIGLGLSTAFLRAAFAQQTQKVYRVGFLFAGTLAQRPQAQGFWEGLRELGYIPGKNVLIEVREAEGKLERLPQLAQELVNSKPDVIVAVTPAALSAAQKATAAIPIVMAIVGASVQLGFVKNPARPEGNITGPSMSFENLNEKRLQLFQEMLPNVKRIGLLWNARNTSQTGIEPVEATARSLGLQVQPLLFQGPDNLESVLTTSIRGKYEALFVISDPVTFDRRASIIAFAAAHRLPSFHVFPEEAFDGGLAAYGSNLRAEYRRVAPYVARLLKGAKPADLPVEQATNFELIINMKTARLLGVTIPQSVLLRADRVIE